MICMRERHVVIWNCTDVLGGSLQVSEVWWVISEEGKVAFLKHTVVLTSEMGRYQVTLEEENAVLQSHTINLTSKWAVMGYNIEEKYVVIQNHTW